MLKILLLCWRVLAQIQSRRSSTNPDEQFPCFLSQSWLWSTF